MIRRSGWVKSRHTPLRVKLQSIANIFKNTQYESAVEVLFLSHFEKKESVLTTTNIFCICLIFF